jgi:hypothetical protein
LKQRPASLKMTQYKLRLGTKFMTSKLKYLTILFTVLFHGRAIAERVRDFDSIIGAEAASLGGAYTALSEDASGVFYNPGGLAFSKTQGISLSSTSLDSNKTIFKNALGNSDLTIDSGGLESNFIGSTFSLSEMGFSNWYAAFGIFSNGSSVTNKELRGENNQIQNIILDKTYVAIKSEFKNTSYSLALSKLVMSQLGVGITLGLNSDIDSRQQFFNICYSDAIAIDVAKNLSSCLMANAVQKDEHHHAFLILGSRLQLSPVTSIGMTLRGGSTLLHRFKSSKYRSKVILNPDGSYATESILEGEEKPKYQVLDTQDNINYGKENIPLSGRLGMASSQMDSRLLVSADVSYFHKLARSKSAFEKNSTLNYAVGLRYQIDPKARISSGVFTNYDFRNKPKDINGPLEKIDYLGGSISMSYLFGTTRGYFTAISQFGKGHGIPIELGDVQPVVEIKSIKRVLLLGIESGLN